MNLLRTLSCGFFVLIACALLAESSTESRFHKPHIQGRVSDGRYYGYGDVFSIELPSKSNNLEIEDFYAAPNMGGVAFFNDSGFLLKLEIDELLPEVTYLITKYPELKQEILDALFVESLLPQLKTIVPKLQLLDDHQITFATGEDARFAVIELPETATIMDSTGRNLDSNRGFLLFFTQDNKQLVNLSLQDTLTLIPTVAEAAKARLSERLLNHIMRYQATFRLESPSVTKSKFDDHTSPIP